MPHAMQFHTSVMPAAILLIANQRAQEIQLETLHCQVPGRGQTWTLVSYLRRF